MKRLHLACVAIAFNVSHRLVYGPRWSNQALIWTLICVTAYGLGLIADTIKEAQR